MDRKTGRQSKSGSVPDGRMERSVVKRIGKGTMIVPFLEAKDVFEDN
jgi:hypothetical protein